MGDKKLKPGRKGEINGVAFEMSSGNVFADLGLPVPDERQTKARLAAQIAQLLAGTTQVEAAALLGIDQPKVSKLLRGQLRGFSTERLMAFLARLGQNVEIRISPVRARRAPHPVVGHISVTTA